MKVCLPTSATILSAVLAAVFSAFSAEKVPGFFRMACDAQGWWRLVDPSGRDFWIAAVNGPSEMRGDPTPALGYCEYTRSLETKFGTNEAARTVFAKSVHDRLRSWGFNAISGWDKPLPGTVGDGIAHLQVVQLGKSFAKAKPCDENVTGQWVPSINGGTLSS